MKRRSFKSLKNIASIFLVLLLVVGLVGCGAQTEKEPEKVVENKEIVLSTTTSTKDSGLLDKLLPVFEEKTGYEVKVISQGTGQALKTGELGDCDVVLVHSRPAEDQFVADGFGVNRKDVMHNDYVVVGPAADPLGIKGLKVLDAFKKMAETQKGEFISRGDESGTHKKEMALWKEVEIKPEGKWYLSIGKGMGDTLLMTNEKEAYTMTDRGTYASMMDKLNLEVLVEGDPQLLNPYGVIAVNPEKHAEVNYDGAMAFIEFMTSQETKELINDYKVNGQQLFFAD